MSGGPVTPIHATFLGRGTGSIVENDAVAPPTSLNFTTDMRQFSGAFDLQVELGAGENFAVQSHDFVELWFKANGIKHQIGVGFLEDFKGQDTPQGSTIMANGREFSGQLIQIPFRKQIQAGGLNFQSFLRKGIAQGYFQDYANFRGLPDVLSQVNTYAGNITVITQQTMMVGALIEQYAELALNIAYQNRLGQLEVYGRGSVAPVLAVPSYVGTLCDGFGQTNVDDMEFNQNFSKVYSEATIFWTANQASVDSGNPNTSSQRFTNADPRVAQIYQPLMKTFCADDLVNLSGGVTAAQRITQVAQSEIRKSMQNVNNVTVTVSYPYYTVPSPLTGAVSLLQSIIPYEINQIWRIRNQKRSFDTVMRLAGIHYQQDASSLHVQLNFVEPDTLV